MKTIVCNFNLFDAQQRVDLYNDEGHFESTVGYATLDKLSTILLTACQQFSAENVHFFGNKQFLDKIAEDTRIEMGKKFKDNNIKIEVN